MTSRRIFVVVATVATLGVVFWPAGSKGFVHSASPSTTDRHTNHNNNNNNKMGLERGFATSTAGQPYQTAQKTREHARRRHKWPRSMVQTEPAAVTTTTTQEALQHKKDDDDEDENDDDMAWPLQNMVVLSSEIQLPCSVEVAFDAFSDLSRQPEWSPWLRSVEYTSPTETVWKMRRFLGLSYSWTAVSRTVRRPQLLEWESTRGVKNYGRVEFHRHPQHPTTESSMTIRLAFVVPRLVSRVFVGGGGGKGEEPDQQQGRLAKFVRVRMVQKSLRHFRQVVLEQQQQQTNTTTSATTTSQTEGSITDEQDGASGRKTDREALVNHR